MKVGLFTAAALPLILLSLVLPAPVGSQASDSWVCGTVIEAAAPEATPEPYSQNLEPGPLFRPYGRDDPAEWWEFHPLGVFVSSLNDWVFFQDLAGQQLRIWQPEFSGNTVIGVERYEVAEGCEPLVDFWADRESLAAGECTLLHWMVDYVSELEGVSLNGEPVDDGRQERQICPAGDTTYVLRVAAGWGEIARSISISVFQPAPPPEPSPPEPVAPEPPAPEPPAPEVPEAPAPVAPAAKPNLVVAFDLSPMDADKITVLKPNLLRLEATNIGDGPFTPLNPRDYKIQLIVKKPGAGKVEEHTFTAATGVQPPDLPARLEHADILSLRVEDVYLYTPVENAEVQVFFWPAGESNLDGNGSVQTLTIWPHPESAWSCAAWVAKAVSYVYPPAGIAAWVLQMNACGDRPAAGPAWGCYAEATAFWAMGIFRQVGDLSKAARDAIKLMVQFHDLQKLASAAAPPCTVAADWIKAMVQEWSRQGLPINAVLVHSPAYPLVTTAGGQRVGYLEDGQIVAEVPDAAVFEEGDSKVILYPGTDTAEIRLEGSGNGPVSMSIVINQPDGATALDFPAFQVNPLTVGTIDSGDGLSTLRLDHNGDGVEDAQVAGVAVGSASPALAAPEPGPTAPAAGAASAGQDARLAAGLGILALVVTIAGAALLILLVRARAAQRTALSGGAAAPAYGPLPGKSQQLDWTEGRVMVPLAGPWSADAAAWPRPVLVDRARPERRYGLYGSMSVGRSRGNTIVLEHAAVSRRHARLDVEGGECWILDSGSTNGTFVNGRRVRGPQRLQHGDVVRFAEVEFLFADRG